MKKLIILPLLFLYSCNEAKITLDDAAISGVYIERNDLPDIKADVLGAKAGKTFRSSCYKFENGPYYGKYATYFDNDVDTNFRVDYELEVHDNSSCTNLVDSVYYEYKIDKMSVRDAEKARYDINLEILAIYDFNWDPVDGQPYTPFMISQDSLHTHFRSVGDIDYQVLEFYVPSPTERRAESIRIPFEYKTSGDSYRVRRSESSVLGMMTVVTNPLIVIPFGF